MEARITELENRIVQLEKLVCTPKPLVTHNINEITVEKYKKSLLIKGDTKPIKELLKQNGGKWNSTLGGWIFSAKKIVDIVIMLQQTCSVILDDETVKSFELSNEDMEKLGYVPMVRSSATSRPVVSSTGEITNRIQDMDMDEETAINMALNQATR